MHIFILTKGTHDDKHILGVFSSTTAATQAAQRDYNNYRGPALLWETAPGGGAMSEWNPTHPDPYRVERWEVID